MEIVAGNAPRKIISQTEHQGESIETLSCECGQILSPEGLVVIPGLVLHVAHESARDAPHLIGGLLLDGPGQSQCGHGVSLETHAIRQFQKRIDETRWVRS